MLLKAGVKSTHAISILHVWQIMEILRTRFLPVLELGLSPLAGGPSHRLPLRPAKQACK